MRKWLIFYAGNKNIASVQWYSIFLAGLSAIALAINGVSSPIIEFEEIMPILPII
jgi:hypothetical protein